jgi:hypothetical protein
MTMFILAISLTLCAVNIIIISCRMVRIEKLLRINIDIYNSLKILRKQNAEHLEEVSKDIDYNIETFYRELKADILHVSADFYRMEERLKAEKESTTDSPVMPPRAPKRGRPRLEPEAESDSKTSDTPL